MTMLMLRDHLSLVLAAMLLAVGLGVPLGLASYLYPKAGQVILRLVDLIQTTPALALLGVIMVAMGPGKPTVVVGLALYSLLPIVRNTSLGLSQVPAYLKEAGDGMGMTRAYRLRHVELPLALPMIFTGVRIAAVNAIGTAVFAAFVGGGGLGGVFYTAIRQKDLPLMLKGTAVLMVMALVLDLVLSAAERRLNDRRWRKPAPSWLRWTGGVACAALCAGLLLFPLLPQSAAGTLVLYDGDYTEVKLMHRIIRLLVEDQTDLTVDIRDQMTQVNNYNALRGPSPSCDLMFTYDGTVLTTFLGRDTARYLLEKNSRGSGLALIEGVMGYYDGIGLSADASAYDLARATGTPAVLVLDGRGRALTAAAAVKGMRDFRPDSGIRGVILNRVSPMLYPRLKEAIEGETGVTVYGYLPNLPGCALESRHLGLVTAAEVAGLREKLSALAAQAEKSVDIDGLLALAASAPALDAAAPALPPPVEGRPRIAVARDKAFCFYYADGLELLETLGAELAEFSPLADESLPEGACGLYLGGGYPELFAGALAANAPMREAVRAAVAGGLPTVAECGGFLYLNRLLSDGEGRDWPMAGALPGRAANTGRLGRFGYVTLTAKKDGLLGPRE